MLIDDYICYPSRKQWEQIEKKFSVVKNLFFKIINNLNMTSATDLLTIMIERTKGNENRTTIYFGANLLKTNDIGKHISFPINIKTFTLPFLSKGMYN